MYLFRAKSSYPEYEILGEDTGVLKFIISYTNLRSVINKEIN